MIFRFLVVRLATKAPIQGARIVLEHGESDGITDAYGRADIRAEWYAVYHYSVTAALFESYYGEGVFPKGDVQDVTVELGDWHRPTDPPPPGEEIIGTVGTSCDLLQKYMFERTWYSYRNRYTGKHANWDSEYSDVQHQANQDPGCFAPPPPPPKTVEDVQKDVDILRGTLQGISSRVQDLVTSVTEIWKALADLEARLTAWIEESATELRKELADLDARVKVRITEIQTEIGKGLSDLDARFKVRITEIQTEIGKGLSDLDARFKVRITEIQTEMGKGLAVLDAKIRAWIEEQIVAILLRALDREVAEEGKK